MRRLETLTADHSSYKDHKVQQDTATLNINQPLKQSSKINTCQASTAEIIAQGW